MLIDYTGKDKPSHKEWYDADILIYEGQLVKFRFGSPLGKNGQRANIGKAMLIWEERPGEWTCYLIRCKDGSLYCGVTKDLNERLEAHRTGKGAKDTRGRGPFVLVASRSGLTKREALQLEYKTKKLPKGKKIKALG